MNSSTNPSSQLLDPVFNFYNNSGQLWLLTAKYGFLASLCLLGIFLNTAMVYVTFKTKSMHNRCNVLIALGSFFYIPLLLGMSVKYVLLQIGVNFIPLLHCYFIQCLPLFSTSMASSMQLCIGTDRLISVLFPIWYMTRDRCKSFAVVFSLCFIRAIWIHYLFNTTAYLHPDKLVMCSSSELVQPEIQAPIQISATIMNLTMLSCYALIWVVIACKQRGNGGNQQIEAKKKKLIKSLTVLIAITLFGYIQTTLWRSILAYVHFDALDVENFVIYPTLCLYIISDSSNAPILYFFSAEYKKAFKKQLGWIVPGGGRRSEMTAKQSSQNRELRTITMNVHKINPQNDPFCDRQTLVTMRQIVEARNAIRAATAAAADENENDDNKNVEGN